VGKKNKNVTVSTFSGDKNIPKLEGCIYSLCAFYKLLQLCQCLTVDTLRAIQNLGHLRRQKIHWNRNLVAKRRQIVMYVH